MNNKVFILGSSDPEMDLIETLLLKFNLNFVYAMKDNHRVYPNESYSFDFPENLDFNNSIFIECIPECISTNDLNSCVYFDHHEPYTKKHLINAHPFLASSLGQLISYIIQNKPSLLNLLDCGYINPDVEPYLFIKKEGVVIYSGCFTSGYQITLPQEIVLTGSIDHSILDSYHSDNICFTNSEAISFRYEQIKKSFSSTDEYMHNFYKFFDTLISIKFFQKYVNLDYLFTDGYSVEKEICKDVIFQKRIPTVVSQSFNNKKQYMFYGFNEQDFDNFLLDFKDFKIIDNRKRNYIIAI